MKNNSYFRHKTSTPTLQLDSSNPSSLAALMGKFRNEGQNQNYCLRAKPDTGQRTINMLGSNMLGSKYNDTYEQTTRNYQTINKENNTWNNASNPNQSRFKQLTPKRQQLFGQSRRQRSQSKSPINSNYYADNSNRFVFKAKQNKTLGNLIQMAQNYQNQNQRISPNKVYIKKPLNNLDSYFSKYEQKKTSLGLQDQQLEKQICILKQNLSNIALQSLPKEAVDSAIHIQIQDFLSRLIPSRISPDNSTKQTKNEAITMQTSSGMPVNFSFDISYQEFLKSPTENSGSEKIQSSIQQPKDQFLMIKSGDIKLLSSKSEQTLNEL